VKSIRANLVLWLVGALAVGIIVVLAATYSLTRKQVGILYDDEMKQVAYAVHLREDWVEAGRVRIARSGFFLSVRAYDEKGRVYFETALPSFPLDLDQTFGEGFVRVGTTNGTWRVYTHVTKEGIVQVGQPLATRDALARDLSFRVLVPMLVLIPLLAAFIAWVLKRAFAPLDETSRRVSDRDAARLDPLPTENVPDELLPLVGQINALLGRLASSLDGQRRFLADAAHELRSPVAALALQAQLAERAQPGPARAEAFRELGRGIERARRLVQQLLDYARLEPGIQPAPHSPVDLARVARAEVGANSARAEELGVDLGADAPVPVVLAGSEAELRSLAANLLDNALRYAPRDSAVTISVREDAGAILMAVVDSGPGIPQAERSHVFERFHRVAGDLTPGSGLGLAIAKSIVERHGGSIQLSDAHPDAHVRGLQVTIRFPVSPRPQAQSSPQAQRGRPEEGVAPAAL
jgi:two-component system OmpR family sensor kinase